jgi:KDO2-lipid IV(A) lauroyltransferase
MKDVILYIVVRCTYSALSCIPHPTRVWLFSWIVYGAFRSIPRLAKTIDRNLSVAFPEKDAQWRKEITRRNATEIARLFSDSLRLSGLNEEWIKEHVSCSIIDRYADRLKQNGGKGILIATGHLGSFELLGHAIGLMGYPLAAVARNFQSPRIDRWWTSLREARGNRIIGRRGAFKEMVQAISEGTSVAVLFDQNVTRNHAVFVKWFDVLAATTKSVALAALRTEVPVFVAAMRYAGDDRYIIDAVECDVGDIYNDTEMTVEEKVQVITERLTRDYCTFIQAFPEGWFWMHRRWKTRPDSAESMY